MERYVGCDVKYEDPLSSSEIKHGPQDLKTEVIIEPQKCPIYEPEYIYIKPDPEDASEDYKERQQNKQTIKDQNKSEVKPTCCGKDKTLVKKEKNDTFTCDHVEEAPSLRTVIMNEASSSGDLTQTEKRERFLAEILRSESEKSTHFYVMTKDKYLAIMQEVDEAKKAQKKTPMQRRRLMRFDVVEIEGIRKLIARNEGNKNIKYYLSADEIYDVIDAIHMAVGHSGRDKMLAETSKKFANVTTQMICLYLSMCTVCQEKKTKRKRELLVFKPILRSEMNRRCQVDLIDFQTQSDGDFKFIMVYQDHLTKFVLLRALHTKRPEEVALHLKEIFFTFGVPCILQSDNGQEFVKDVIIQITSLWPELKIVPGKPWQSQSQGSIEQANRDIENMLNAWMNKKKTTKWSEGLHYIQFMKNRTYHSGIKQSPYKAMFGTEPRVGLSNTSLSPELLNNIEDEEDLLKLFEDENNDVNGNENMDENELLETSENILEAQTTSAQIFQQAKKLKATSDNK